jgi:hypothetical protein
MRSVRLLGAALAVYAALASSSHCADSTLASGRQRRAFELHNRGGARVETAVAVATEGDQTFTDSAVDLDGYSLLAHAVQENFPIDDIDGATTISSTPSIAQLVRAFKSLSAAQKTFKGLDGAAYEAYQRTQEVNEVDLSVAGRALRSAARLNAVAHGLGACELCELVQGLHSNGGPTETNTTTTDTPLFNATMNENTTIHILPGTPLGGPRHVLLNTTLQRGELSLLHKISALVLYEPNYRSGGGAGAQQHASFNNSQQATTTMTSSDTASSSSSSSQGRLLIVVGDVLVDDLAAMWRLLQQAPRRVALSPTRKEDDIVWVQPSLYQAAADLVRAVEPILRRYPHAALHFCGRSLSGAIAALASAMVQGDLPLPNDEGDGANRLRGTHSSPLTSVPRTAGSNAQSRHKESVNTTVTTTPLSGLGRGRTSAVSLGAPPCLAAKPPLELPYVTAILFGDDMVCRLSPHSMRQLVQRTQRTLQRQQQGGGSMKPLHWMADTLALATSTLPLVRDRGDKANQRLTWASGPSFLIRPRRLGQQCSMHQLDGQKRGGWRAAVLWQLDNVLLSRSMWKHHQLDSYIHGLDRVHLRGLESSGTSESPEN